MKTILLGNAGSGKSTLAGKLAEANKVASLSLDALAFSELAERRPLADSIADAMRFVADNENWVVEGCYSDIVTPLLPHADRLVFLNPGVEACIRHCRARPWEPDKFASAEQQDSHLDNLLNWVREYETREDEYGLSAHRAIYDAFAGDKVEYTDPADYEAL